MINKIKKIGLRVLPIIMAIVLSLTATAPALAQCDNDSLPNSFELGDDEIYDDCTILEVQNPTAWDGNDITFNLNTGYFDADDDAWIHVVDDNNDVLASFPITIP